MALTVRNIIAGEPLVEDSPLDGEHSDRFRVKLDSPQVPDIVESLNEYNLRDMGEAVNRVRIVRPNPCSGIGWYWQPG